MIQYQSGPGETENKDERGADATVVKLPETVEGRKKPFGALGVQIMEGNTFWGADLGLLARVGCWGACRGLLGPAEACNQHAARERERRGQRSRSSVRFGQGI